MSFICMCMYNNVYKYINAKSKMFEKILHDTIYRIADKQRPTIRHVFYM